MLRVVGLVGPDTRSNFLRKRDSQREKTVVFPFGLFFQVIKDLRREGNNQVFNLLLTIASLNWDYIIFHL